MLSEKYKNDQFRQTRSYSRVYTYVHMSVCLTSWKLRKKVFTMIYGWTEKHSTGTCIWKLTSASNIESKLNISRGRIISRRYFRFGGTLILIRQDSYLRSEEQTGKIYITCFVISIYKQKMKVMISSMDKDANWKSMSLPLNKCHCMFKKLKKSSAIIF